MRSPCAAVRAPSQVERDGRRWYNIGFPRNSSCLQAPVEQKAPPSRRRSLRHEAVLTTAHPALYPPAEPATNQHPTLQKLTQAQPSRFLASQILFQAKPIQRQLYPRRLSPPPTAPLNPAALLPPPMTAHTLSPLTMESIPRITQPVSRPQGLRPLPLGLVDVGRAYERAPPCDRVGPRKGEGDRGPGGGMADETGEIEPPGVRGVEGGGRLRREVQPPGPDDLRRAAVRGRGGASSEHPAE